MDDYIRREDASKAITKLARDKFQIDDWYDIYLSTLVDVDDEIKTIPSADVRPAVHGKWIWDDFSYHCSECEYYPYGATDADGTLFNYCPMCGAIMEGEEEE